MAFLLAFAMLFTQLSFGNTAYAAQSNQPNVYFEKSDGSQVQLDGDTLYLPADSSGKIVVTVPADYGEYGNFDWINAPEEFVGAGREGDWGSTNQKLTAQLKKTGDFTMSYKYENTDYTAITKSFDVKVTEAENTIDALKVIIRRDKTEDAEVIDGGRYDFLIADGARAYVDLYGSIDGEWVKQDVNSYSMTADSTLIDIIGPDSDSEKNSFLVDEFGEGREFHITVALNSNPDQNLTFSVVGYTQSDKVVLSDAVSNAKALLEDKDAIYDPELVKELEALIADGEKIIADKNADQDAVAAAADQINDKAEAVKTTPVIYLDENGTVTYMEDGTFVLNALTEGKFKVANIDYAAFDWDCWEEYVTIGEEGTEEIGYHFWINEDGTYQPHGAKIMTATVTLWGDKDRTEEIYKNSFKIDTRSAGVEQIKVVDSKGDELKNVTLQGREWMTVSVKGLLDGEWIDIPAQAFIVEPQKNIHVQGNRFCLWTANDEYTIVVKMVDDESVKTSFTAVSDKVDVESFKVTVPKTTWELDKWDTMSNSYVGIRYYADPSVDLGYHVEMTPSNATNQELNWESSDPSVAVYSDLNSAGIIPKNPGKVTFTITSKDNPSIPAQKLDLEFVYKTPVEGAKFPMKVSIEAGTSMDLQVGTIPTNATEQRFHWSYDKEGIVTVTDLINVDENGNTVVTHTLSANDDVRGTQTVVIKGVPFDNPGHVQAEITVTVIGNKAEWIHTDKGWWYRHADGSYTSNNWEYIDGSWYYFDSNGWMVTGWQYIGDSWYYMNTSGAMVTGWQYMEGSWYYMNTSGAMVTGWYWIEGTCYYFYSDGHMAVNTWINGSYVDASGAWTA